MYGSGVRIGMEKTDYYASSPSSNPKGPNTGQGRVLRGGSWRVDASGTVACPFASASASTLSSRVSLFRLSPRQGRFVEGLEARVGKVRGESPLELFEYRPGSGLKFLGFYLRR